MRILMTTDTVGGVWTYALELASALAPSGAQVVLATMGPSMTDAQRRAAAAVPNVTIEQSTWKLEWMTDPWADVAAAGEWLLELETRHAPDVVHLNGYSHGALAWRSPTVVVAHSCVASWWRAVKGADAPAEWDDYRAAVTRGLHAADFVVAPSRAMLRALGEHYGAVTPSRVIYNARNPASFGQRRKRPLILSAGRMWDEAKNLGVLDAVAPELDWPVYVAGDGADAVYKNTHALGQLGQPALAHWMGEASIYCLPARYEPFGLSALEAALCGSALVLGDIDSLREIWGDAAVYVDPADAAAVREVLKALIDDAPRRQELAHLARARALRYSPKRMANAYRSVYRHLCDGRAAGDTLHTLSTEAAP